jgi:DNA-binding response OmpR family regulator
MSLQILIVDDDARLRSFLSRGLIESEFQVSEAANSSQAREQIAALGEDLDHDPARVGSPHLRKVDSS